MTAALAVTGLTKTYGDAPAVGPLDMEIRAGQRVVLVGQGRKFELWDESQWQVETAQAIAFPADGLPPELSGFSL